MFYLNILCSLTYILRIWRNLIFRVLSQELWLEMLLSVSYMCSERIRTFIRAEYRSFFARSTSSCHNSWLVARKNLFRSIICKLGDTKYLKIKIWWTLQLILTVRAATLSMNKGSSKKSSSTIGPTTKAFFWSY